MIPLFLLPCTISQTFLEVPFSCKPHCLQCLSLFCICSFQSPLSLTLLYPFAFSLSTSLPYNLPLSAQKGNYKSIACTVDLLPFPLYLNSALIRINSKLHYLSQKGEKEHASTLFTHSGPHRAPVPVHTQTHSPVAPGSTGGVPKLTLSSLWSFWSPVIVRGASRKQN